MKKLLLVVVALCFIALDANAQQDARYTQFMFNKLAFNPAYAGSGEGLSITALGRMQWVSQIDGAPNSGSFSLHSPFGVNKQIGAGLNVEYDEIGVHQRLTAMLSYSYNFIVGDNNRLSLGLQGGVQSLSSAYSEVTGTDGTTLSGDPVFSEDASTLMPNFGLGLYFYKPNRYYLGASVPHLLESDLGSITQIPYWFRHYHFMGGLVVPVADGKLKIKPAFLVKYVPVNAPTQVDANLMFLIADAFWIGATYRAAVGNGTDVFNENAFVDSESIDAIVVFNVPKTGVRIGYAYDYTLSELQKYNNGSHELMLGLDLSNQGPRIRTPRYF